MRERSFDEGFASLSLFLPRISPHTHSENSGCSPNLHMVSQTKPSLTLPKPTLPLRLSLLPAALWDQTRTPAGVKAQLPVCPLLQKEGRQRNTSSCAAMSSSVQVQLARASPALRDEKWPGEAPGVRIPAAWRSSNVLLVQRPGRSYEIIISSQAITLSW